MSTPRPTTAAAPHVPARRPLALRLSPRTWLLIGVLLLPLVGMRFNVGMLAWVAPVPWLLYLRQTTGWRSRLLFAVALQVAVGLQLAKIITDPIPWFFAPLFSVPMALGTTALYLGFEALRRRLGDAVGLVLLPAMVVVSEWAGWTHSEFGSWGALAYTQLDNLPLLQTVSVFGLSAIAFLITAVAGWLAVAISDSRPARWSMAGALIAVLVIGAHSYGVVRLALAPDAETVTVGGVVSDLGLSPAGMPTDAALAENTAAMFARSQQAADAGAQVVAWNEGGTAVYPDQEAGLIAQGQTFATETGADLVLAYIVPHSRTKMLPYDNKYVWLTPDGGAASAGPLETTSPLETYRKHHPVPGEGAIRGTSPIRVHDRPYGRAAGAICYDYDFPALGQEHAAQGAGLVVVPSSDWRGIDPYHTQMAQIRGIEGGYSVLRPVRWATSTASDAYGRVRGSLSAFEGNDNVLVAGVPTTHVATIYSRAGNVLPWMSFGGFLLAVLVVVGRGVMGVVAVPARVQAD
jgi:apolipoprotein N-acyltransferase